MRLRRRSDVLKLLFIIEFAALIIVSLSLRRDYQDSWTLEGLEFQFVAFSLTYVACFLSENRPKWLIVLACMYALLAALLPSLKYVWFQGVAIDQNGHYELARTIFQEGHIPAGRTYTDTPIMQTAIAIFSMVTNLSITDSFKIFPILCWISYPILIYALARKLFPQKSPSLSKYALLIASIPIVNLSYLVVGSTYGALLICFVVLQVVSLLKTHSARARNWTVLVFFLFSLTVAHSYSSIMILILFTLILVMDFIFKKIKIKSLELIDRLDFKIFTGLILISLFLNSAWLSLKAENLQMILVNMVKRYFDNIMGILASSKQVIPSKFFKLGFLDQLRIVFVFNGSDFLLISIALFSFLVLIRKTHDFSFRKGFRFLRLYFLSLLALLALQVISSFGALEYQRLVNLMDIMCPIFIAVTLFYLENVLSRARSRLRKSAKLVLPLIIVSVMIFAMIEFYAYQPIVPSVKVDVNGIADTVPVVEIGNVNSAYQRYMIYYAEKYISVGGIACDRTTLDQIIGLNYSFYLLHVKWYYPYSTLSQGNITQKDYDYFLIHLPGKSGVLGEPAETRGKNLILSGLGESNIIYNNGESFICGKPFMMNESIG